MMAGTEQPKPINMGMKLLPWRPILCISRSITKAALAMYPLSSRTAMARKRRQINHLDFKVTVSQAALLLLDRNTRIVPDVLSRSCQLVEKRGFP